MGASSFPRCYSLSGQLLLLALATLPSCTFSWVYPRSADDPQKRDPNFETVHAMRKRLGINYTYTPSLLHPEMCRFVTEEVCESIDNNLRRHAASHRRLQGSPNPNLGKIKVLVLLVQFRDHQDDRELVERSVIEETWRTDVKRWFSENSQGSYEVDPVVVDWVLTDNTETFYASDSQGRTPDLQRAMYPALDKLDKDPNWDWSQFDVDQDGQLDAVVMMHSGIDGVTAGTDCKGKDSSKRIYSHAYATTNADVWTSADSTVTLNGYAVASVYNGNCDREPFTIGIVCHEYMHTMGLPDLYDGTDTEIAEGVGLWDIMSDPYGPDKEGTPVFLSTWCKEEIEWAASEEIVYDGIYVLKPASTSKQAYRINNNPIAFLPEYLLIENRQQISFDTQLPASGLMIYHVDDLADGMKNRGFPGQQGWPGNNNHYRLAVLPKDGSYDLERNVNKGDAGDMWLPGDVLGPGMGNTVFPNTDSYQSGTITENGITITVLSQAANGDIVFEVSGLANPPEGTTTTPTPPPGETGTGETTPVAPDTAPLTTTTAPTPPEGTEPETTNLSPSAAPLTTTTAPTLPNAAGSETTTIAPSTTPLGSTTAPTPTQAGPVPATDSQPQVSGPVATVAPRPIDTTAPALSPGTDLAATTLFVADQNMIVSSAVKRTVWNACIGLPIVLAWF